MGFNSGFKGLTKNKLDEGALSNGHRDHQTSYPSISSIGITLNVYQDHATTIQE